MHILDNVKSLCVTFFLFSRAAFFKYLFRIISTSFKVYAVKADTQKLPPNSSWPPTAILPGNAATCVQPGAKVDKLASMRLLTRRSKQASSRQRRQVYIYMLCEWFAVQVSWFQIGWHRRHNNSCLHCCYCFCCCRHVILPPFSAYLISFSRNQY